MHLAWDESQTEGRVGLAREEEWSEIGSRMEEIGNEKMGHPVEQFLDISWSSEEHINMIDSGQHSNGILPTMRT